MKSETEFRHCLSGSFVRLLRVYFLQNDVWGQSTSPYGAWGRKSARAWWPSSSGCGPGELAVFKTQNSPSSRFLDPSAFHIPVWAPPQAHSPRRGDSFILIKSSWLRLPHCYLDMWSLTLPSVSSQQGNTSQNLPSTGLQYKVTFHFRNESYYHGLNV